MKAFLNIAEAAQEIGVSEPTIERALAAGDLTSVSGLTISGKRVRRTVIGRGALVAWVEGSKPKTDPAQKVSVPTSHSTYPSCPVKGREPLRISEPRPFTG